MSGLMQTQGLVAENRPRSGFVFSHSRQRGDHTRRVPHCLSGVHSSRVEFWAACKSQLKLL